MIKEFVLSVLVAGATIVAGSNPVASTNDLASIDASVKNYTPETAYLELLDTQGYTWAFEDCPLKIESGDTFKIIYLERGYIPVSLTKEGGGDTWNM